MTGSTNPSQIDTVQRLRELLERMSKTRDKGRWVEHHHNYVCEAINSLPALLDMVDVQKEAIAALLHSNRVYLETTDEAARMASETRVEIALAALAKLETK